jgi:hypothetical protein
LLHHGCRWPDEETCQIGIVNQQQAIRAGRRPGLGGGGIDTGDHGRHCPAQRIGQGAGGCQQFPGNRAQCSIRGSLADDQHPSRTA